MFNEFIRNLGKKLFRKDVVSQNIKTSDLFHIPPGKKEIYEFYKVVFAENGCPMTVRGDSLVFHPLYPAYLIRDYVSLYERGHDKTYLELADKIWKLSLDYSSNYINNSIVFMYNPEDGLTKFSKFYSGLTQSRYLICLCNLHRQKADDYSHYIKSIYNSLLVPVSDGGVFIEKDFGWIVEEYPSSPGMYVLNGWLTVIMNVIKSMDVLSSIGIDAKTFVDRNIDAVDHLLPLYDVPNLLNSRYKLSGSLCLKIVFDKGVSCECRSMEVEIPEEGIFSGDVNLNPAVERQRFSNFIKKATDNKIIFNIVLSMSSFPRENIFRCKVIAKNKTKARVYLLKGTYRPDDGAMKPSDQQFLGEIDVPEKTLFPIEVSIPFDQNNLFAWPTNFRKNIGNKYYNVYHFVHISDLAFIYAYSKRPSLKKYCLKWLEYYENWESVEEMKGYPISYQPYGYSTGYRESILNMMDSTT